MSSGKVDMVDLHVKTIKTDEDGKPLKKKIKVYALMPFYHADLNEVQTVHLNIIINRLQYVHHFGLPPFQ